MKLKGLIALLLVLSCRLAGQGSSSLGVEIAGGITSLRGNAVISAVGKPSVGIYSGLTYQYSFNKLLALKTGIGVERKGNQTQYFFSNGMGVYSNSIASNFDYLILPLLLRVTLGEEIRFFVNTGPFVGYLLRQQDIFPYGLNNSNSTKVNSTTNFKALDYGVSFGLGMLAPVSQRVSFSAEFRGNLGLNNISKLPVFGDGYIRTSSALLIMGFSYRLAPKIR